MELDDDVDHYNKSHVQAFVSSLHQAVTSQQRCNLLHQVLHQFNDPPENTRSYINPNKLSQYLVEAGFIHGLVLQFGFLLVSTSSTTTSSSSNRHHLHPHDHYTVTLHDLELVCQTLAMIYRHCPDSLLEASVLENASNLMPLLIRCSTLATPSSLQINYHHHHQDNSKYSHHRSPSRLLFFIFSIWHSCSSNAKLSSILLVLPMQDLLSTMVLVVRRQTRPLMHSRQQSQRILLEEQVELLGCLKNLSYYANDEQRLQMVQFAGFVSMLCQIVSSTVSLSSSRLISTYTTMNSIPRHHHFQNDFEDHGENGLIQKISERISAVVRNLAVQPTTRRILSQQTDFIGALLRLGTNHHPSKTLDHHHHGSSSDHTVVVVLRNILTTLQSLALEEDGCQAMVLYGDGMILDWLCRLLSLSTSRTSACEPPNHHHYHHHHNSDYNDTDMVIMFDQNNLINTNAHHHQQQQICFISTKAIHTIRKRSIRIVKSMTSSTYVVPMIVHHNHFLNVLLHCALHDTNRNVKMDAARSFCQCACVWQASSTTKTEDEVMIQNPTENHHHRHEFTTSQAIMSLSVPAGLSKLLASTMGTIPSSLLVNSISQNITSDNHNVWSIPNDPTVDEQDKWSIINWIVHACKELSVLSNPYNRYAICCERALVENLAFLAMMSTTTTTSSSSGVREDVLLIFWHLSKETSLHANLIAIPTLIKALVWNAQSFASSPSTTTTFTSSNMVEQQPHYHHRQQQQHHHHQPCRRLWNYTVSTLVNLASHPAHRSVLVSYSGLLSVLIHFAAATTSLHDNDNNHDNVGGVHREDAMQSRQDHLVDNDHPQPPPYHHQLHHHYQPHQQDLDNNLMVHAAANKDSVKSTILQLVAVL